MARIAKYTLKGCTKMPRRCFFSFHYEFDCHRASQVREIGSIDNDPQATGNEWEVVRRGGDPAIERWIAAQMNGRSCTVVLIGAATANRKWINYEIIQAWNRGIGVVGIYIHGLKNLEGRTTTRGQNPFDYITHRASGGRLSSIVKCYDPAGADSKQRYGWIVQHLANAVEEAISIRKSNY